MLYYYMITCRACPAEDLQQPGHARMGQRDLGQQAASHCNIYACNVCVCMYMYVHIYIYIYIYMYIYGRPPPKVYLFDQKSLENTVNLKPSCLRHF